MRRNENSTGRMNRKPIGMRPRGRPGRRWMDVVEQDLYNKMRVQDWREVVQDRNK